MTTDQPVPSSQKVAGNLLLVVSSSVWATHFLITDTLLIRWDPYFLTAGRLMAATFFLLIIYSLQTQGHPLRRVPWKPTLLLGTVGIGISTTLLTLGVKYAGAVPAAIVAASAPIVAAFVARAGFGIRLSLAVAIGAVIAVAGGVIASLGAVDNASHELRGGELLILAAVTVFTWYSLGVQRWMSGLSFLGITTVTIMIGAVVCIAVLPLLVGVGIAEQRYDLSWNAILSIAYLGAGPASFSLFCWHWGVSRVGVTIASIYTNLVPVVVVLIRMIEGQPPTTSHLVGGSLIIFGVLVAQLLPSAGSIGRR